MTIAEYRCTTSVFSGEARFGLGPGGITHEIGTVRNVLPLAEVASVALAYEPSRADLARYTCTITGRRGHVVQLQSTSYRGVADFVSQADAYRAFVLALHRALLPRAGEVRFGTGVSTSRYLLNLGCLLVSLPLLLGVLALFGTAIGIPAVLHLVLIAVLLPFVWKWMRRNRPGTYDPRALPDALLPAAVTTPAAQVPLPPSPTRSAQVAAPAAPPALPAGARRYTPEDFGPIAEPGDQRWYGAAGTHTHWADAERYAREANEKLDQNLIGPPRDPPPQGEQPLR